MATGYNAQGDEAFTYDLGWVAPAGQMYSTVNDLMKVTSYVPKIVLYIRRWKVKFG